MKTNVRKIVYWGSSLSIYALLVAVVFSFLVDSTPIQSQASSPDFQVQNSFQAFLDDSRRALDFSAVLLPVGPNDALLPGLPEVWDGYQRAAGVDDKRIRVNGFDGLQAVQTVADLSRGAVAELYLSGVPHKVFRKDNFLLLSNQGRIQIVDCNNPRAPKLVGFLPYQYVLDAEILGNVAYLLLKKSTSQKTEMVVVDLKDILESREIARFRVPEYATAFHIEGRQLVVYSKSSIVKSDAALLVYNLTDDFQLIPLGRVKGPPLEGQFVLYGNYLLSPGGHNGLTVYDFSDPLQYVSVATLPISDEIKTLSLYGDRLFLYGGKGRVYVVDLHDPVAPLLEKDIDGAEHSVLFLGFDNYTYYFTKSGHLRVFDVRSVDFLTQNKQRVPGLAGELVSSPSEPGFTVLGETESQLPEGVKDAVSWPFESKILDSALWQGGLAILDDGGRIQFFQKGEDSLLELHDSLTLSSAPQWLATTADRLYAGGESVIDVVTRDDGKLAPTGLVELANKGSWDGLVVQGTLFVAAGPSGLLTFSLKQPDRPVAIPGWTIPRHLKTQIDVRQLASSGGNVFAAAGSAGLLSGQLSAGGQLQFNGFYKLSAPVYALAVVDGLCLVSTGTEVYVVDIRSGVPLQNLGKIAFPGVERFTVSALGLWAGYAQGQGWFVLPSPRFLSEAEARALLSAAHLSSVDSSQHRYRMNLFNQGEVVTAPGVLSASTLSKSETAGATHNVH